MRMASAARALGRLPAAPCTRVACLRTWLRWEPFPRARQHARRQWRGGAARCAATTAAAAAPEPAALATAPAAPQPPQLQTFDYTTLAAAVTELQDTWVPAKVEAVVQQEAGTALRLRTPADSGWLHLCYHPRFAHVGTGDAPARGSAAELYSFGAQLQSALRGLVLTGVALPAPWERCMMLAFAARPSEPPACRLVFECARYSNLLLLGDGDVVLAAAHQVGQRMSSVRQVQVGGRWAPPPLAGGLDPDSCTSLEEWRDVLCRLVEAAPQERQPTLVQAAVRCFRGVSPQLARDLAAGAGVPAGAHPADLSHEQWQRLHAGWQAWLHALASRSFAPSACPRSGAYSAVGAQPQALPALLPFLRALYSAPQQGEAFERLKSQLGRAVAAASARLARKAASLAAQGGQGDKHEGTRRLADMVLANAWRIPPGAASAELEDWDTGELVTIQLDASKTAVAFAEGLYKQARKQRRAAEQVAPLLAAARRDLAYLEEAGVMLAQLEGGAHLGALLEAQADLVAAGFVRAPPDAALADKAAARARKAARRGGGGGSDGGGGGARDFRRYTSPSGLAVLVGRNSRQNDELSCRVGQPGDVWAHARGVPGAHVLLRVPAGSAAAEEDVAFAADLAAWFSKARGAGKVDVTTCDPRHLTKPSGAKPGQVLVKREAVVVGRPDRSAAAQRGETE